MDIEAGIAELRAVLTNTVDEERLFRLIQAWLVILRDAYHVGGKRFSQEDLLFLKSVRSTGARLHRFTELREELEGDIDLNEYNQALQELKAIGEELSGTAVSRRVQKEIRGLLERRSEVLRHEQQKENARTMKKILDPPRPEQAFSHGRRRSGPRMARKSKSVRKSSDQGFLERQGRASSRSRST